MDNLANVSRSFLFIQRSAQVLKEEAINKKFGPEFKTLQIKNGICVGMVFKLKKEKI